MYYIVLFIAALLGIGGATLPIKTSEVVPVEVVVEEPNYIEYNEVLGMRESGGVYDIENRIGYIGKYQWGSLALQDIGAVNSGIGAANSKLNNPYNWTGKFGNNKQEFLTSPDIQEAAMVAWNKLLDKRMANKGFDKYVGTKVDGVVITLDGLRAASHLLGVNTVNKLLKNGNLTGSPDANGTTALEYIKLYSR